MRLQKCKRAKPLAKPIRVLRSNHYHGESARSERYSGKRRYFSCAITIENTASTIVRTLGFRGKEIGRYQNPETLELPQQPKAKPDDAFNCSGC